MQIVVLKLKRPGHHWEMGSFVLNSKNPCTKSFDLDAIDIRMKQRIIRAAEVFKVIEICNCLGSPEMVVDLPKDAINTQYNFEEITVSNCEVFKNDSVKPSNVIKEIIITEIDRENAKKLLAKTIKVIKNTVLSLPYNSTNRTFILCLLQEEKANKNRKTITNILEKVFLAIPPEEV